MHKFTFLVLICFSCLTGFSQNLKKIIDFDDSIKLEKYVTKYGNLDTTILIKTNELNMYVSPLAYAEHNQKEATFEYMLSHMDLFSNPNHILSEAFIHSLSKEDDKISERLYKMGVNINDSCSVCYGNNAIMVAAAHGNEKWYFKLKPESDLLAVNREGANLAHCAASSSSKKIVEDIAKIEGLDFNKKDIDGLTPLDYSVWNTEFSSCFDILRNAGAELASNLALRYGYNTNPDYGQFEVDKVEENRENIFYANEDQANILDFLAFEYGEITSDQYYLLNNILDVMKEEISPNCAYTNDFVKDTEVTYNMIIISYFSDDEPENEVHLFRNYVEFIGKTIEAGYASPFSKKDYKKACKFFGKDQVNKWFSENGIPEV